MSQPTKPLTLADLPAGTKVKIPAFKSVGKPLDFFLGKQSFKTTHLIVASPYYEGDVTIINPLDPARKWFFSPADLELYEESAPACKLTPLSAEYFTEANQPFELTGTVQELDSFRKAFKENGFDAHTNPLAPGDKLLVNFEPDYPPYMRVRFAGFGVVDDAAINVVTSGTNILNGAVSHAAKATKASPRKRALDAIVPAHYNADAITTFDVVKAWQLDFFLGNTLKYIQRHTRKGNALEDLRKAAHYLNEKIAQLEAQQP